MDTQIKSKDRVAAHGEVFTNPREVNAMLDLVKAETERIDSRFLEPACGDGNFLIEILRRKLAVCEARVKAKQYTQLQYEHDAIWAISSIYGIELLADNATSCRERLLNTGNSWYLGFNETANINSYQLMPFYPPKGNAIVFMKVAGEISADVQVPETGDYEFSYLVGEYESDGLFSDLPAQTFAPINFLKINANAYGE